MNIGNPVKLLVKVTQSRGRFIVSGDNMEISASTLHLARRLAVTLRRTMDEGCPTGTVLRKKHVLIAPGP